MSAEANDEASRAAQQTLSEHLANERTMLAYVRTAIALLGFGLTLNRFGAFLRGVQPPGRHAHWYDVLQDVDRMGLGMMILGLGLLVWSALHFVHVMRAIERRDYRPKQLMMWLLSSTMFVLGLVTVLSVFVGR